MDTLTNLLYITRQHSETLKVVPGEYRVSFGKKAVNSSIIIKSSDGGHPRQVISLPDKLGRELDIPEGLELNIIKTDGILRVGPLIGVLANGSKAGVTFGGQDKYFRSLMASIYNLNAVGYIFRHNGIDWGRKRIRGYYIPADGKTGWAHKWFPFPDVCYNRFFRGTGNIKSRDTMAAFIRYGVESFNTSIPNKWGIYKLLNREPELAPHLPETRFLESIQAFTFMINRYKSVYIKPVKGCKGQGIIKVSKNQGYYLFKSNIQPNGLKLQEPLQVMQKIEADNLNNNSMIIQQSIKVPGNEGHFDCRVLAQRDQYNVWQITGIAARVGASGSITTNLHTGGHAENLDRVLENRGLNNMQIISINAQIKRLSVKIAEKLGQHSRALGELGLDFIIDGHGKVWFLEANPKPGRRCFTQIDEATRRLAVSRPIQYAYYLAGF